MAPLASDRDVQDAVVNRVTTAVMAGIDVQDLLTGVARPRTGPPWRGRSVR